MTSRHKTTLRNNENKVLGYIDSRDSGFKFVLDTSGREIGRYHPRTNTTNIGGRPVMTGDFSLGLLGGSLKR